MEKISLRLCFMQNLSSFDVQGGKAFTLSVITENKLCDLFLEKDF